MNCQSRIPAGSRPPDPGPGAGESPLENPAATFPAAPPRAPASSRPVGLAPHQPVHRRPPGALSHARRAPLRHPATSVAEGPGAKIPPCWEANHAPVTRWISVSAAAEARRGRPRPAPAAAASAPDGRPARPPARGAAEAARTPRPRPRRSGRARPPAPRPRSASARERHSGPAAGRSPPLPPAGPPPR